ncbi:hypothetical protein PspLS_06994 [Pyricularia sp. CBS 133598]|nr:hypothetical protein PspLS_06994 [Pyricularia sp. CBS 133598]
MVSRPVLYAITMAMSAMTASAGPCSSDPCAALSSAGLQDPILRPNSTAYQDRINTLWSASARLTPACIVTPKDAKEVALVLKTLQKTPKAKFAIRSRGHSHWAGGDNVNGGVQIDLSLHFVGATYNPDTKLASVLPASRWGTVFKELEQKHGVAVVGGRDGNVGIGGFLTGGGNSFHTAKYGFGCDNVINAEVVLADGRIINVNKDENADLFKALKGGWGNFGIVTRFDLFTFPSSPIWGGPRFTSTSQGTAIADSMINFTANYAKHRSAAYLINWTYIPSMGKNPVIAQFMVDTEGVEKGPAFTEALNTTEITNILSANTLDKLVDAYVLPAGKRNVWYTLTFANDARVINKAAELNSGFVSDLLKVVPANQLGTQMLFQPMPKLFFENGLEKGGNVMGMDRVDGDSLQWLLACTVETPEQEKFLHERSAKMESELSAYAKSIGSLREWQYINYADPTQDPMDSYGPANVAFLKQVSAKYDPTGFFQKQQGAGIRLPKA